MWDLIILTVMGETHIVEYKSIWKDEWLQWICGYANAEGGTLYIGLADAGTVVGLQNVKKLMEDIPNKIVSKMNIYPDVRQLFREGKDIIEIEVYPSQEGVTLDGVLYKRVGATNQVLKGTALKEFYERKMKATWDSRVIPGATLDDIDPNAIKYFLTNGIDKARLPKESINDSPEKVLRNLEVMTPEGQLTIAALLLFGKNPQQYCLNARIKIGRFGENQGALMTQDLVSGDLIRMADRVMNELSTKYLIHPIHYKGMHREEPLEIPEDGLREILYNAIIHKDYNGPDSQMRVFDDRITFWNLGTLPKGYTLRRFSNLMIPSQETGSSQMPFIWPVLSRPGAVALRLLQMLSREKTWKCPHWLKSSAVCGLLSSARSFMPSSTAEGSTLRPGGWSRGLIPKLTPIMTLKK